MARHRTAPSGIHEDQATSAVRTSASSPVTSPSPHQPPEAENSFPRPRQTRLTSVVTSQLQHPPSVEASQHPNSDSEEHGGDRSWAVLHGAGVPGPPQGQDAETLSRATRETQLTARMNRVHTSRCQTADHSTTSQWRTNLPSVSTQILMYETSAHTFLIPVSFLTLSRPWLRVAIVLGALLLLA